MANMKQIGLYAGSVGISGGARPTDPGGFAQFQR